MSRKSRPPVTPALRLLRKAGVTFTDHLYDYVEKGGTGVPAAALGVDEHAVIKTLVMESDRDKPLLVLMHGDCQVSTRELARAIGVRRVAPCDPVSAQKHTGYPVGGTSPFGTRQRLPIYIERSILELDRIYINGGHRGYLVGLDPAELARVLAPVQVEVAIASS